MKVIIIDYGAGNIKSIQFALKRLGVEAQLSNSVETIRKADKVIFPGVGEASSAMKKLKVSGLYQLIPKLKQPVLGICLGMQLMCESTEEGQTVGLGVFKTKVRRFSNRIKVPQIGWNTIKTLDSRLFQGIKENEYMYGIHSFYAEDCQARISKSNYDLEYASALQWQNFYGVQFHPEKSGQAGAQLLKNFIEL